MIKTRGFHGPALFGALGLVLVGTACSSARSVEEYPRTGLAQGVVTLEPALSPGQFVYRPRRVDLRDVSETRVGEQRLLLGPAGQRWTTGNHGELIGAQALAPEPLVAVGLDQGALPYWFVGKSGRVYRSGALLGGLDAESVTSPPEPLVRVTAGSGVILGLTTTGHVVRSSDRGQVWSRVNIRQRAADVALLPSGAGLVLASPEAYHLTRDAGLGFEPLALAPAGVLRLEVNGSGVDLVGVLGTRHWSPEQPTTPSPAPARAQAALGKPAPQTFANAQAVASGTALLEQRYYLEVEGSGSELGLWRGRATDALERLPISLNGCREPRLAGGRDELFLVCGALPGKVNTLRIYRSPDEGRSFREEPYKVRGDGSLLDVAVWGGQLVWTGICAPEEEPTGCVPSGVFAAVRAGTGVAFRELELLGLSGTALAMTVSPTSGRLLVFGATNKGDELVLYSGTRATEPFEVTALEGVRIPRSGASNFSVEKPAWGEDGFMAATVLEARLGRSQLVIADDKGHVLQVRPGPTDTSRASGVGMKAIATEPRSGESWESLDGGEHWHSLGKLPIGLCSDSRQQTCEVNIACFSQGCLIADELARLGWGGQGGQLEAPPEVTFPKAKVELQAPIVCRIAEDALWKAVPGGQIPEATGAALGDLDWFTHRIDWSNASVTAYEMGYPAVNGRSDAPALLREESVFDARSDAADWVLFSSSQTEGVAALRGKVGSAALEVAWRNLFRSQKTLRWPLKVNSTAGTDQWSNIPTRYLARAGQPGLVSIAAGGVFVRPGSDETQAKTWLVQETGETRELPPFAWTEVAASGRTEMSQVGPVPLGLKLFRNGAVMVSASLEKGAWHAAAMSVGVDNPTQFNLHQSYDLGYVDGAPHYHLWQVGPGVSEGWLFPLRAGAVFGEPIAVATQQSLGTGDEPRVCDAAQRRGPRVIAPAESRTMHSIIVRHNSEPTKVFLSRNAVVYGRRDDACVAVYEGESVSRAKSEELQVLVRPDPSQPSWTFRRAAGDTAFEYRAMSCEFDVAEATPPEAAAMVSDAPP